MIGILFDFNGTMFFDESFQEESWKSFLMKKTGRAVTEKEFQKYIQKFRLFPALFFRASNVKG